MSSIIECKKNQINTFKINSKKKSPQHYEGFIKSEKPKLSNRKHEFYKLKYYIPNQYIF